MDRVIHRANNFQEADDWDILQHIQLSPKERQEIARKLRERFYGTACPDVREYHRGR